MYAMRRRRVVVVVLSSLSELSTKKLSRKLSHELRMYFFFVFPRRYSKNICELGEFNTRYQRRRRRQRRRVVARRTVSSTPRDYTYDDNEIHETLIERDDRVDTRPCRVW